MRQFWFGVMVLAGLVMVIQRADAVVVTPESATLTVAPGNKVIQTLYYENDTDVAQAYSLTVSGLSFGTSADDLRFEALGDEEQSWIELNLDSFEIDQGQERSVAVTVMVPADAAAQTLAFAVIAASQASTAEGVGVATGLASVFFVEIGEQQPANLQVETFEVVPSDDRVLPIRLAALVSNVGAGLAQPDLVLSINNVWGKEVAVLPLNSEARRVPSYTNRVFSDEWQGSPWRFGLYTATLYLLADDGTGAVMSKASVVLFPGRTLGVFAVLAAGLIAGAVAIKRARRR